jgi:hypothetical protein
MLVYLKIRLTPPIGGLLTGELPHHCDRQAILKMMLESELQRVFDVPLAGLLEIVEATFLLVVAYASLSWRAVASETEEVAINDDIKILRESLDQFPSF